jgi:hypothetical protein
LLQQQLQHDCHVVAVHAHYDETPHPEMLDAHQQKNKQRIQAIALNNMFLQVIEQGLAHTFARCVALDGHCVTVTKGLHEGLFFFE